jgi:hypothetical protein
VCNQIERRTVSWNTKVPFFRQLAQPTDNADALAWLLLCLRWPPDDGKEY